MLFNSRRKGLFLKYLLIIFALIVPCNLKAQNINNSNYISVYQKQIDSMDNALDRKILSTEQIISYQDNLFNILQELSKQQNLIKKEIKSYEDYLNALVAAPKESLDKNLSQRKKQYELKVSKLKADLTTIELLLIKITEIKKKMSSHFLSRLLEKSSAPINPSIIFMAAKEFFALVTSVKINFMDWAGSLPTDIKDYFSPHLPILLTIIILGIVLGMLAKWTFRSFSFEKIKNFPIISKKTFIIVSKTISNSLIPVLILCGIFWWMSEEASFSDGLWALIKLFLIFTVLFFLWLSFTSVIYANSFTEWNISPFSNAKNHFIYLIFMISGLMYYSNVIIRYLSDFYQTAEALPVISDFIRVIALSAVMLPFLIALRINKKTSATIKALMRLFIVAFSFSIIAGVLGYISLALYVAIHTFSAAITLFFVILLRKLSKEFLIYLLKRKSFRIFLRLNSKDIKRINLLLAFIVTPVLILLGVIILMLLWGFPKANLIYYFSKAVSPFSIGGLTVSPIDIIISIISFIFVFLLSGKFKASIKDKLLIGTTMDESIKDSLASGATYIFIILGAFLSIGFLGISFTNIAILVSALSVGIGFGLQNIVNNFISGIIILIERPIKIGDWVVVGDHEGIVTKINIRSTELETFKKASVLIPNADILSTSIINWTHENQLGRVDINVGLEYGSDVEKAKDVLLACAKAHKKVLRYPAPYVIFAEFGGSSLDFMLRCFTADVKNSLTISSDLRFDINKKFMEENINIPFPQMVVHKAKN